MKDRLINLPAVICIGCRDTLIINIRSRAIFPGKLYHSILYKICPTLLHCIFNFVYLQIINQLNILLNIDGEFCEIMIIES